MINSENYYEKTTEYLSVSQYHDFLGCPAFQGCEAKALAKLRNQWIEPANTAMLVGSYVDAYFEGTLEKFKANNPEIFTQKKELRADFKHCEKIIEVAEADPFFMKYMAGEKQKIVTGTIDGISWKGKIDVYHPGKAIVDLKVLKGITERIWCDDIGKCNILYAYGYFDQAAIYQELIRQETGQKLDFLIAALAKEEYPDKQVIMMNQDNIDFALSQIIERAPKIQAIKDGLIEPDRCGKCDYCRSTKKLSKIVYYTDLC